MKITRVSQSEKTSAVELLTATFYDYPVMRYILHEAGDRYREHLRALLNHYLETRWTRDWPVLGAKVNGVLAGVAGIDEPTKLPWPPELENISHALTETIGLSARERMDLYENRSAQQAPDSPHYFLGILGVDPAFQKQGLAKGLISELIAMSECHHDSTGICLNTEDPKNLKFYRHLGFEVIDEADIGNIHTWCLFRPDYN